MSCHVIPTAGDDGSTTVMVINKRSLVGLNLIIRLPSARRSADMHVGSQAMQRRKEVPGHGTLWADMRIRLACCAKELHVGLHGCRQGES